ncbi:MAG: hypothetical protein H0U72_05750 [Nitrosospira sp.]|nr:hypothetical protein [Nitrosospira sp.]
MMHGLGTGAVVHAVPQPLSPFNWKIIVSHGEAYDVASVNLWDAKRRRPAEPAHAAEGILGA